MNEERIGYQIRQRLNAGLNDLPGQTLQKLEAARRNALAHQKIGETRMVLGFSGKTHSLHSGHDHHALRRIIAITALLLGMAFAYYWDSQQSLDELEEIDSALLRDELPPEAYLDKGFAAWLKRSSDQ